MQAVELPLVESARHDGLVYLLFPRFDEKDYQGVQYELHPERGLIYVFGYEQGFDEEGDAEGVGYPIAVPEENMELISSLETLRIVDPESVAREDFDDEEDYDRVIDRYTRFRDRQG